MSKKIGSFYDKDNQLVEVFDDMTYRYEGYPINMSSSHFKIDDHGYLFYRHDDWSSWHSLSQNDNHKCFTKNILRIYSNYITETLLLGGE